MNHFTNLAEVIEYFHSEEKCRSVLEKMRWPDGNIKCPKCGAEKSYRLLDMKHYKCRVKSCATRFSVIRGTVFEGTKLPLKKWFIAMYLLTAHKKGVSSHQLARDLGIGQKAAWFVLCRLGEMLRSKSVELLDNIVEVDETYVGGKWDNMSKDKRAKQRESGKDNKTPVMGLIERDGNVKLTLIGKDSFKDVVRRHVSPDAQLVTDSHLGYRGLAYEFAGHATVNHTINQFKDGVFHTNSIEGFFSHFKRTIFGIYHQVSPKHLHRYCDEFVFRYNTRKVKDTERFIHALQNTQGRLKWKDLTAK